jgi:hypothetical protein
MGTDLSWYSSRVHVSVVVDALRLARGPQQSYIHPYRPASLLTHNPWSLVVPLAPPEFRTRTFVSLRSPCRTVLER